MQIKYGFTPLSPGHMLREAVDNGTDMAAQVEAQMSSGSYVSDELIVEMVGRRLMELEGEIGVILDGFPRTIKQAEAMDTFLKSRDRSIDLALFFSVRDEFLLRRAENRFTCGDCGEGYNILEKSPQVAGVCDICKSHNFIYRADDNSDTMRNRLGFYHSLTEPILPFFEKKGILKVVDAEVGINKIGEQIVSLLENM